MKILGYQKDFFDSLIYTYGVDNSIVLDRTVLLNVNKDVSKEMYNLNTNYYFFSSIEMFFGRNKDQHKQLMWEIYHGKTYNTFHFYFDGYVYLLYCKIFKEKYKWSEMTINIDDRNVYDLYKGEFKLLLDTNGVPIRKPANDDLIQFSKKYKLPYYVPEFKFFFPFLAINDHAQYFDANDVYQRVESFLLNASIGETDLQSNDNKITAHGFDTKSSFRKGKD